MNKNMIILLTIIIEIFTSCVAAGHGDRGYVLDKYRNAGFSESFISDKRREIVESERQHEEEYDKNYNNNNTDIKIKYENEVVLDIENLNDIKESDKDGIRDIILKSINEETGLPTVIRKRKNNKYYIELRMIEHNKNIIDLLFVFYKQDVFYRSGELKSTYILNNIEKQIPINELSKIFAAYIKMYIKS